MAVMSGPYVKEPNVMQTSKNLPSRITRKKEREFRMRCVSGEFVTSVLLHMDQVCKHYSRIHIDNPN